MSFRVDARHAGGRLVVAPRGELDISTVAAVRAKLEERRPGEAVQLDLAAVSFVDTSGLQLAVELHRRAGEEGYEATIVRGTPRVQRVFEMVGLDAILPFVDPPGAA